MIRKKLNGHALWYAFLSIGVVLNFTSPTFPQESNHKDRRTLRVGELSGRVDIREFEILTTGGPVTLLGNDDNRLFRILSQQENRIEIEFASFEPRSNHPQRIVFNFYESEQNLISELILDKLDFAILENEASAQEVSAANQHFLPLPVPMPHNFVKMIFYNHRGPILASRDVRRALSFAINHEKIIERVLGRKANLAYGPFDSDSPLYNPGMNSYNHSPKTAIRLLHAAGWQDTDADGILDKGGRKLSFELIYERGLRIDADVVRQIKINLLEIQVDITPRPMDKWEINDRLRSHDFDAAMVDQKFENSISTLEEIFSKNGAKNFTGYFSTTFENRLRFYHEVDEAEQKRTLIRSLQQLINDDQPATFLYFKWLTHYVINVEKLDNFRDLEIVKGRILPFEKWIIKPETHR